MPSPCVSRRERNRQAPRDGVLTTHRHDPMKLRKEIEKVIREANEDRASAAQAICEMLETRFGLSAQGGFDDDPLMREALLAQQPARHLKALA